MVKAVETEALQALRACERPLALNRFASSFAHELGTPLNVITGHAAMIAAGEMVGEDAVKSAKKISEQATRLTDMIRRVIRQTQMPPPQLVPVSLTALLEAAVAVSQAALAAARVTVEIKTPSDVSVLADRGRFLSVLMSLLDNAIQAMPDGGRVSVVSSLETIEPPPDSGVPAGAFACVSVSDTGVGIAPERLGDIFRSFYSSKEVGSGLGLALAQTIVREHRGFMTVASTPGQGSSFKICLPQGEKR